jgi:hypothetical protein
MMESADPARLAAAKDKLASFGFAAQVRPSGTFVFATDSDPSSA